MADQTCQTCRHFSPDYMRDECRRYPPTTDRVWPMVYAFDWCGEWAGEEPDLGPVFQPGTEALLRQALQELQGLADSAIAARQSFEAMRDAAGEWEAPAE